MRGRKAVTDQEFNRLESIRLFRGFNDDWTQTIERQCRWRTFDVDEKILDRDNVDNDVFFLTKGSVLIVNDSQSGRETVTRAISQLVADGIAQRKQKSLYVHDRKRFEHLASALDPDWGEESVR